MKLHANAALSLRQRRRMVAWWLSRAGPLGRGRRVQHVTEDVF